jgi:uncharacterized membrane protein
VTVEVLRMLVAVADAAVGDGRRAAVRSELELVVTDARRMIPAAADLDEVECAASAVRAALEGFARPPWQANLSRPDHQTASSFWVKEEP